MEEEGKVYVKRNTFAKLGNCYAVFISNKLFVLIGPHWPFIFCVAPIIITVLIGFLIMVAPQMGFYWQFSGFLIIMSALFFYILTAFRDPGVVLNDNLGYLDEDTKGNVSLCRTCLIFRDSSTEHCEDCGICMKNIDHHCIFTGKCIAQKNLISFYMMLVSIFGFFVYSMFWVLTSAKQRI